MDDIRDKVEEIMNNLDKNEPKFVDPVDNEKTENTVNILSTAPIVPVKKKKKSGVANMIKFIVWVLLLPFACEAGLTLTILAISNVSLGARMLSLYIVGTFVLQCLITLWVDWVLGRRKHK